MEARVGVGIVGAGQAGLALGYELARRGCQLLLIEAAAEVGHSWRRRWDSLRLFTPCPYNSLPGLPFPAPAGRYPTKDAVADYLAQYAAAHNLPLRLNCRVERARAVPDGFVLKTTTGEFHARQLVVATGPYQTPFVPALGAELPPEIYQLHSSAYRNPGQLPPGELLVVGAGNSGVQIAEELAATRLVTLSVGSRAAGVPRRLLGRDLFWWLYATRAIYLSGDSPLGRLARRRELLVGTSLGRLSRRHGVRLVGRSVAEEGGAIRFAGGGALRPRVVVWATGYRFDYGWLEAPVCDARGAPIHRRGVTTTPGLYFLGLPWQSYSGSSLLGGVGRDAAQLAERIVAYASRLAPLERRS